jgi:crotonobetainyl-CoA:carnitine CoA-transferase CaiB-like acyl-CoA transferase
MQPFSGIKVLDVTHVLAGPFATYQLALLGADVIKIEPPRRLDMARGDGANLRDINAGMGVEYQGQAANKRSLLLDLSCPTGQRVLRRMASDADVLVENYTAGTLEHFSLGADDLAEVNPRLIYCSMTGFGRTGAKSGHPAYDNVIQAYSGLMHATGTDSSGPIKVGPPVLDYATGTQAAFAIAAALLQRERTGRGQRIDVAMLDAAIVMMTATVMDVLETGSEPRRLGNAALMPGYGAYEASDGLLMIGAYSAAQHERLYRLLGLDDLADEVKGGSVADMSRRAQDAEKIRPLIRRRSATEWEVELNAAHIPAARVRSLKESLATLAKLERRVLQSPSEDPANDRQYPSAAFQFAEGGPSVRTSPPRPGQHSRVALQGFGFSDDEIEELMRAGVVA